MPSYLISQIDVQKSREAECWQEFISQLTKSVPEFLIPAETLPTGIFSEYCPSVFEQQLVSLSPLLLQLMQPVAAQELAKLHIGYFF